MIDIKGSWGDHFDFVNIQHEINIPNSGRPDTVIYSYVLFRRNLSSELVPFSPNSGVYQLSSNLTHIFWFVVVFSIYLQNQDYGQYKTKSPCLQMVQIHEKLIILGCQWLSVAWKPSRRLVCVFGDNFLISFTILLFTNIVCNLPLTAVPENEWSFHDHKIMLQDLLSTCTKIMLNRGN